MARSAGANALDEAGGEERDAAPLEAGDPAERVRRLAALAGRVAPVSLACEQVLPVLDPLVPLLPGGLRRGSSVGAAGVGATSLALALAAGPVANGSWAVVVGAPRAGLVAAHRLGVHLGRLAVVDVPPPERRAEVVGALVGAFDVILLPADLPLGDSALRRVAARLRERGSVLVRWGRRPVAGVDLRCTVHTPRWHGLGDGHGTLRARQVEIEIEGRGAGGRPRRVDLWLPGPDGTVQAVEPLAPAVPLHAARRAADPGPPAVRPIAALAVAHGPVGEVG